MERIPTEIWRMVLGNLVNSQDYRNAYKTCHFWKEVLQPLKASWLFGLVFPHVQNYLPISDALKCRTICKHWLQGVNSYLQNNHAFRSTFEESGSPNNVYKTDERLDLDTWPSKLFSGVVEDCDSRRDDMIRQVPNYSSSLPVVGRWFRIYISPMRPLPQFRKDFLETFGPHIWFLQLGIGGKPVALEVLKLLLEYLPLFPNLKRLQLDLNLIYRTPSSCQITRRLLNNYLKTGAAATQIQKLPKCLETLELYLESGGYHDLKQVVLELMSIGGSLQSVILGDMCNLAGLELGNIVDLSVTLMTFASVQQMFTIKSPVRRLKLGWDVDVVPLDVLFKVSKHFRESLRNLHLELDNCVEELTEEDSKAFDKLCFSLEHLANPEVLKDLKNVKRMTLHGSCLLSLNFLCGLSRSLEYLHVRIVFGSDSIDKESILRRLLHQMGFREELDLMEGLRRLIRLKDKRTIYKSNVWKVFPKMRELTVQALEHLVDVADAEVFVYRRDVYDKLIQNSI